MCTPETAAGNQTLPHLSVSSIIHTIVFAFLALILGPVASLGQTIMNEYVTQPEVWRSVGPLQPGVDAKGDLGLSIPVMTIPGNNGLDYTIRFSYQSGIRVKQKSGWIGLGWSFDPGSITRDVQSGLVKPEGSWVGHNADFAVIPTYQPDVYHVTTPGGSFTMSRRNWVNGPAPGGTLGYDTGLGSFIIDRWQPWKIEYKSDLIPISPATGNSAAFDTTGTYSATGGFTAKADFTEFVLRDPGGTRYVFANPQVSAFNAMDPNSTMFDFYVSSWRLVAILGPDYVAAGSSLVPDTSSPSTTPDGSWIKFEYTSMITEREQSQVGSIYPFRQLSYLSRIETPTHYATFTLVDVSKDSPESFQNLSTMKMIAILKA